MEPLKDTSNVTRLPGAEDARLREPPHNFEAEQALLGSILVNNAAYQRVAEFLRPEHFADPAHGKLYDSLSRLIERGQVVSAVTLKTYVEQDPAMKEAGGAAYLARLAAASVHVIDAAAFGRAVHDLYLRRQLIDLGENVVNGAFSGDVDETALQQIEVAEKKLYDLATTGQTEGGFKPFRMALTEAMTAAEAAYGREGKLTGVATGLVNLDQLLGGLHRSDLLILAGRPSMGKTAFVMNCAQNAALNHGIPTLVFSLEMSKESLIERVLCSEARVESQKLRSGMLETRDWIGITKAAGRIAEAPMWIDDGGSPSLMEIRTKCRRWRSDSSIFPQGLEQLGLVVIDYLQLMHGSPQGRDQSREREISEISRGLKALAKELKLPVLALSQLNRSVEARADKRPMASDLRESGAIEQDADVICFIYRDEYYNKESPDKGVAEIIIGKQRNGPTGTARLAFLNQYTRFENLAEDRVE